jgi:hypothetical protein
MAGILSVITMQLPEIIDIVNLWFNFNLLTGLQLCEFV